MTDTLITVDRDPYFRRRPVNVRDEGGVFSYDTEPWQNIDEFEQCCELLDAYQKKTKHPGFWTAEAWFEMLAWGETQKEHRAIARDLLDSSKRRAAGILDEFLRQAGRRGNGGIRIREIIMVAHPRALTTPVHTFVNQMRFSATASNDDFTAHFGSSHRGMVPILDNGSVIEVFYPGLTLLRRADGDIVGYTSGWPERSAMIW